MAPPTSPLLLRSDPVTALVGLPAGQSRPPAARRERRREAYCGGQVDTRRARVRRCLRTAWLRRSGRGPATRSTSSSVIDDANGSASARSNAASAPGKDPGLGTRRGGGRRTCRSAPRFPRPEARERLVAPVERARRTPASHAGRPRDAVGVPDELLEALAVPPGDTLARGKQALEPLELRDAERAEHVGKAVVEAGRRRCRRRRAGDPVVAEPADRGGELGLVGRHGAALAGRHDLPGVEREAREKAESAARRPAIAGSERAGGILDQHDVLRHRRLELLPRDRTAEEVDREDGTRPLVIASATSSGRTRNVSASTSTSTARAPQSSTAFAVAGKVYAGTITSSPGPIPSASSARWMAAVPDETATASAVPTALASRTLERLDVRPHRQLAAREHRRDRRELVLADVGPREPEPLAVHAGVPSLARYHAIVRARPSSSSTCASKPSSERAFSTFGIRSSTSV